MLHRDQVGIVLATYNPNLVYLRQQLDSIRLQTWPHWVCHIVDDASDPVMQTAIAAMAQSDPRFVCHFHDANRNAYHNFERGLRYIEADPTLTTVAFADQDDIWHADKLAILLKALNTANALLAHSDLALIDADNHLIHPSAWAFEGRCPECLTAELLLLRNTVTGCASLFRASLLPAILPFPSQTTVGWYHDHWVALAAAQCGTIAHIRKPLVQYRQHTANVVGALNQTGTLHRELQLWLRKGLRIRLRSYQIHCGLSQAFHQRFAAATANQSERAAVDQALRQSSDPFKPHQIDWGVNLLRLGWRGYRANYCPAGITARLWLGKLGHDMGQLAKRYRR